MADNTDNRYRVNLLFTDAYVDYIKTKFDINDAEDLEDAVWEMINTYMEM